MLLFFFKLKYKIFPLNGHNYGICFKLLLAKVKISEKQEKYKVYNFIKQCKPFITIHDKNITIKLKIRLDKCSTH